jgi:hypothetical protein
MNNSNSYRVIITSSNFKEKQMEYHTYQLHENKIFCVSLRNLYPSTNTNKIEISIEEIGLFVQ